MATLEEKKEIKVNKEDGGAIKRALDDNAVLYLTEKEGLHENTAISNIKLSVGFISVLLALTAQFYPANFPDNWYVLAICCPLYFVCSGILQYVLMFKEKDHILFAKDDFENVVNVRAAMPKHDSNYTVTFTDGAKHEESHTKSVGSWIDVNGVLREDLYHKDLHDWYAKFAQKNQKKKN